MASITWTQSPTLSYRGMSPGFMLGVAFSPDLNPDDVEDVIFSITATSSEPDAQPVNVTIDAPIYQTGASYNIKDIVLSAVKNLAYTITLPDYPNGIVKAWRSSEVDFTATATAYLKTGETITTTDNFLRRFYLSQVSHPGRDTSLSYFDVSDGRWFPTVTIGRTDNTPNIRLYAKDKDGNEYDSYMDGGILFLECTEEITEVGVKDGQDSYRSRCLPRYWNNGMVLRYWDTNNGGYRSVVSECGSTTDADITSFGLLERSRLSLDEPKMLGSECEIVKTVTVRGRQGGQSNRNGYDFDNITELVSSMSVEFYENGSWRPCIIEGDTSCNKNGFFTFTGTVRVGYKNVLKWL